MSGLVSHPVEGIREAAVRVAHAGGELVPLGRGWTHMARVSPGQATLGLLGGLGDAAVSAARMRAGAPIRRYAFEVAGLLQAWDEPFLREELTAEARAGHPVRVRVAH
ncbi:MAG: hypothetical protein MUE51_01630 [Thermoleophilia bacterium]|jgi:hypothetical protein|nr:hypothetical protein [Thermoleophilia bacterium]